MSLNRYAVRRDKVESDLVKVARKLGALVVYAPPLDLWIGYRGVWIPVEVKSPRGNLTQAEKQFMSHAALDRLPTSIWRDEKDVIKCLESTVPF